MLDGRERSGKGGHVICATCGKANADHLVFCEDCGARLQPRIAPPTPPIGVPQQPPSRPSVVPAEGAKCGRCGAQNAPGMRFCITCGSPLEKPIAPVPVPPTVAASPIAATMPVAQVAPVAQVPIAASPVVSVAQPAAAVETRTCKRCHGTSDKNAQFCRFCGAPLAEPAPAPAPRPTMPSQEPARAKEPPSPRLDTTLVTAGPSEAPKASSQPEGRLVVVHKDGGEGESFPLQDQVDVGRESGECLFADDRYMAPRHARVTRRDGSLYVRDLGTPNGVYIRLRKEENGVLLEDQDLILLGQQVLRFEIVKDAEAGFGATSEQGTLVFGTPAAPRYARLSQRTTEGVSCDVFHVRKPETVLGRESGDVVFPDDPFMSRRHASVTVSDGPGRTFRLADLGSSNGTFVRIRGEVQLKHGDEVRVGQQLLRVDLQRGAA